MDLRSLRLDDFMHSVIKVNKELADEVKSSLLLDAAKEDMPIIDELLQEIAILTSSNNQKETEKGLQAAQRDLTVFLALRELENRGP